MARETGAILNFGKRGGEGSAAALTNSPDASTAQAVSASLMYAVKAPVFVKPAQTTPAILPDHASKLPLFPEMLSALWFSTVPAAFIPAMSRAE